MSYTKHNYKKGDELLASQLNDMDDQIALNEQTADTLVTVSNTQPAAAKNRVWVKATPSEIEIPTMEDHNELSRQLSDLGLVQIIKNGNFVDASNWSVLFGTLAVANNEATITVSNASNSQFLQNGISLTTGHIYFLKFTAKGSKSGVICFDGLSSAGNKHVFELTTDEKTFEMTFPCYGTARDNLHFWIARSGWNISDFGVGDTVTFKNIMLFDATAMFGKYLEPKQTEFFNTYDATYYDYVIQTDYPVRDFHNVSLFALDNRFKMKNRFDKASAWDGFFVRGGGIEPVANYSVSTFIYVGDLSEFSYSGTFRISLYTGDFVFVADPATQNTLRSVATISVPETVKYAVISYITSNVDIVQLGQGISLNDYVPYGKFTMPDLIISDSDQSQSVVYVSKSNRGSYTSLLEALVSTDSDIEVLDGVFDIVSEYKAKYGDTFFTPGTDRSVAGDFARGLFITNRSVKFDANTSLSFDLSENPASNVSSDDRRFCLFNLGVNVVLDGAIGTTNGNWYAIHDDGSGGDYAQNYKNVIKNCVLICQNMVNKNVIGGGFGRYSETYVENCYFDNGESGNTSYTIRYHNTWNGQAQPVCHIKNVYVNSLIYFGYYGTSTKIGTCAVNNCSMAGQIALLPVTQDSVENLRVLEWANIIRS